VTTSHHIEAGGLSTHYVAAGTSGEPLVLIHGGGAGADSIGNWTGAIAHFAGDYRVFAPDMPGFGQSAKPDDPAYGYTQDERDDHMAAFVAALGVGPVTIVGNSMGGLTAMGVARKRPELIARLVLMGSAGVPVPPSPQLATIMNYDFTVDGMARIVEALTGPGFVAPDGMVAYRHRISVEPATRAAYKRITDWNKARGGLQIDEAEIAAVACPTLVVSGKNDGVVPVTCAYRFLELIPQSWGAIMPNCGHWPMIEHPQAFAEIVDQFVRRH
jgi:2-hydroxy-6-oxo-6-(2'-aminophenyl)hexa-2,4-dienoate hydrolase